MNNIHPWQHIYLTCSFCLTTAVRLLMISAQAFFSSSSTRTDRSRLCFKPCEQMLYLYTVFTRSDLLHFNTITLKVLFVLIKSNLGLGIVGRHTYCERPTSRWNLAILKTVWNCEIQETHGQKLCKFVIIFSFSQRSCKSLCKRRKSTFVFIECKIYIFFCSFFLFRQVLS